MTSGTQAGFTLDLTNMQPGNTINLTYTNTATGAQQQLQIVTVADSSALPLPNPSSASPNTAVVGVNFSGGMASIVSQLNAALGGANLQFSNPSGSTLQVLNGTATGVCGQFGLGDHHDLVADQRQRGSCRSLPMETLSIPERSPAAARR